MIQLSQFNLSQVVSPRREEIEVWSSAELLQGEFIVKFRVTGDQPSWFTRLLPAVHQSDELVLERADELWKETCFEAFLGFKDSPAYLEFNFSPNLKWNAYYFTSYREGMEHLSLISPPEVSSHFNASDEYEFSASIRLDHTQMISKISDMALTAVIKTLTSTQYYACKHMGDRPDFHLRESFTYDLFRHRSPPSGA